MQIRDEEKMHPLLCRRHQRRGQRRSDGDILEVARRAAQGPAAVNRSGQRNGNRQSGNRQNPPDPMQRQIPEKRRQKHRQQNQPRHTVAMKEKDIGRQPEQKPDAARRPAECSAGAGGESAEESTGRRSGRRAPPGSPRLDQQQNFQQKHAEHRQEATGNHPY